MGSAEGARVSPVAAPFGSTISPCYRRTLISHWGGFLRHPYLSSYAIQSEGGASGVGKSAGWWNNPEFQPRCRSDILKLFSSRAWNVYKHPIWTASSNRPTVSKHPMPIFPGIHALTNKTEIAILSGVIFGMKDLVSF